MSSEIPFPSELWSKTPHPIDKTVERERHGFEGLSDQTESVDELL
jgi:hypothetical protein